MCEEDMFFEPSRSWGKCGTCNDSLSGKKFEFVTINLEGLEVPAEDMAEATDYFDEFDEDGEPIGP